MYRLILVCLLCATCLPSVGQTFYRSYDSNVFNGYITNVSSCSDGGFILSLDSGFAKTDSMGRIEWFKQFRWSDSGVCFQQGIDLGDKTYLFKASLYNVLGVQFGNDIHLLRVDSTGKKIWAKNIGYTGGYEVATSIALTPDSGILVLAFFRSGVFSSVGLVNLIKLDKNGQILWERKYGYSNWLSGKLAVLPTGEFYFTCYEYDANGDCNLYLIKADTLGYVQWVKRFVGATFTEGHDIDLNPDGTINMMFETQEPNGGLLRGNITKLDSGGTVLWATEVSCYSGWERVRSMTCDDAGNSFVLFKYSNSSPPFSTYKLVMLDSSGNVVNCGRVSGSLCWGIASIVSTSKGVVLAGIPGQFSGHCIFGTDTMGQNSCVILTCTATATPLSVSTAIDSINLLIGSISQSLEPKQTFPLTYVTLDSCGFVGVHQLESEYQPSVFPNPANGQTVFTFIDHRSEHAIEITDLSGKIIKHVTVVGDRYTLNTSEFSAGLYMYSINNGVGFSTGKLIVEH